MNMIVLYWSYSKDLHQYVWCMTTNLKVPLQPLLPLLVNKNLIRQTTMTPTLVNSDYFHTNQTKKTIGIVREGHNKWERRAPLTPDNVRSLVKQGMYVMMMMMMMMMIPYLG